MSDNDFVKINSLYVSGDADTMREVFTYLRERLGLGVNGLHINPPEPDYED